jgi:hypothetical protein
MTTRRGFLGNLAALTGAGIVAKAVPKKTRPVDTSCDAVLDSPAPDFARKGVVIHRGNVRFHQGGGVPIGASLGTACVGTGILVFGHSTGGELFATTGSKVAKLAATDGGPDPDWELYDNEEV